MSVRTVAEAISRALAAAGATHAFGVPGGGANLDLVGALDEDGVRFVLTHTENAGGIMAATAAELTGYPSLCLATRGPGAASMANGVAHAWLDRCPIIAVTDAIAAGQRVRIGHQRIGQPSLFAATSKASAEIGDLGARGTAEAAVGSACSGPWGPIHLDTVPDAGRRVTFPGAALPTSPSTWTEAGERIGAARRPIVAVGVGARHAEKEVATLVETLEAPVLTTYKAKGAIGEDSPHAAGMLTGGTIEGPALDAADLIVMVGVDPVELIPAAWNHEAPIVYLGPWAVPDPYFPVELEVIGDVAEISMAIAERVGPAAWTTSGRELREAGREKFAWSGSSDLPSPLDVIRAAAEAFDPQTILTVDAGAHMLPAMALWESRMPRSALISSGLATMGFALPAAIAAALVRPDRRVLCLTGDGGLSMCLAELETLARLGLRVTVLVLNDSLLSLIRIKQKPDRQGGDLAVRYGDSDFARVATGFGLTASRVETGPALARVLRESAAAIGPTLIDAVIDPSCYPQMLDAVRG